MANGDMSSSVLNGRYSLEALIGEGGMAKVYRATDQQLDRTVAVKILKPEFASDDSFVDRFRREAQTAAKLNHPNLVGVYDTGDEGNIHYIVMEHIQGRTLADFFAGGGRLAPMKAVQLVEQVAGALSYAHQQGVVHRDIKPGNIMVTREGEVKVTDFGIARLITTQHTIAQTAAVLGTAAYLSPEQARGEVVDERSDIYSLGCVLYESLVGKALFEGDSPVAIAYKHVNEQPPPPSSLNADVNPDLDAVVMRALSKNPVNRYQTADDFRHDLEALRNGGQVSATPLLGAAAATTQVIRPGAPGPTTSVLPPEEEENNRRKWIIGIIVGVLLIGALIAGAWWLASSVLSDEGGTKKAIPEGIVGSTEEDATGVLTDGGFTNVSSRAVDDVPDDDFEPGDVSAVDPAEGKVVPLDREIVLTVVREPGEEAVPSVAGLSGAEATALLEGEPYFFTVQTVDRFDEAPVGTAVRTNPASGESLAPQSEITLVISKGPEQEPSPDPILPVVPNVVCRPEGAAVNKLTKNFQAEFAGESANPSCPGPGRVSKLQPVAESSLAEGSVVRYWLTPEEPSPPSSSREGSNEGPGSGDDNGKGKGHGPKERSGPPRRVGSSK
ncbi:MAG: Stk1 family PASTA domain-containing Ser/Thr kinase [Actinomycetota bacterium]